MSSPVRPRPSRPIMLDAEANLRTLQAYVVVLQTRLALARLTGSRQEFEAVTDGQLLHVAALCSHATEGIDAILDRVAPELASHAALVAELSCQREFDRPRPPAAAHLRLVAAEVDRPA